MIITVYIIKPMISGLTPAPFLEILRVAFILAAKYEKYNTPSETG